MLADENNFEINGFTLYRGFLDLEYIESLILDIEALESESQKYGIRNAEKKLKSVKKLIYSDRFLEQAHRYLQGEVQLVRAIVFDKTLEQN